MFTGSRCSLLKISKLLVVIVVLGAGYMFFNVKPKTNSHPILRKDFIDPDTLRRNPVLHKPVDPHAGKTVVIPNVYTFSKTIGFNHTCVPLKVGTKSTPICVYGSNLDSMISSHIARYGTWEGDHVAAMSNLLKTNKNMHLVDLGCNIGVYTLVAAYMGRKVIAVDPVETNLQLLDKSLKLAKMRDRVVLVHNAISDKAEMVMIDLRMGNIGGSHVNSVPSRKRRSSKILNVFKDGANIRQEKPLKRVKRFKRIVKKPHRNKKSVDAKRHQQNRKKQIPIKKKTLQSKAKVANAKPQKAKSPKIKAKDTHVAKAAFKDSNQMAKKVVRKSKGKPDIKAGVKNSKVSEYDNHIVEKQNLRKVQAITLNDLCKLKTFKPTFVKMDIEGWEKKALGDSDLFRETFGVRYVLMEWLFHRNNPRQSQIANMMLQNGFLPHTITSPGNRLKGILSDKNWPENIYWEKR